VPKDQENKHIKLHSIKKKSRNQNYQQKDYIELIILLEKHDFGKTYRDSKIKMTQTQCIKNKKNSNKYPK